MSESLNAISFAVRISVVTKYLCQLFFILAILNLAPLAVSLYYAEHHLSLRYLILISVLLLLSLPFRWLQAPRNLQTNEAMTIIALAFIISPVFSLITFSASGLSFNDALFEAISAITTTGLSTVPDPGSLAKTFQFARSWMQWYGGLGIIIFSLAFFMGHHSTARRFVESVSSENLLTTARTYARRVFSVYSLLTLGAFGLLLAFSGEPLWSIMHAFSAVSTGGFSNSSASLANVETYLAVMVTIGCIAGALPLALYLQVRNREWQKVLTNYEVQVFMALLAVIILLLTLQVHHVLQLSWSQSLYHGFALGASAQSTAGFATLNINQLDDMSILTLIVSMFVGGNVGSTAGGVKILNVIIFFRLFQIAFQRATLPTHAIWEAKLQNQPLKDNDIIKALLVIIAFFCVIFASWWVFLWYDYPPLPALFEVVSAAMTVGLSTGITRPELEPVLKWVLCMNMWLGRVEILAMLLILYPRNWTGRKAGVK